MFAYSPPQVHQHLNPSGRTIPEAVERAREPICHVLLEEMCEAYQRINPYAPRTTLEAVRRGARPIRQALLETCGLVKGETARKTSYGRGLLRRTANNSHQIGEVDLSNPWQPTYSGRFSLERRYASMSVDMLGNSRIERSISLT